VWYGQLERRVQAALHGPQYFDFSAIIGWKAFKEDVERYGEGHDFTKMIVDLKGKDPDDAFSSVPYEKGFNFLYYLDRLIGREKWDTFIPHVGVLGFRGGSTTNWMTVLQNVPTKVPHLLRLQRYSNRIL